MGGMRRKNHQKDIIVEIVCKKVSCNMTVMPVADDETIISCGFIMRFWIKPSF